MPTEPHNEALPREMNPELQEILQDYSLSIQEIINFGTHILKWDVQKKREGIDNFVPTIFFRNLIELGDSISILIKESSIDPGRILLRSLLENSVYLLYLTEENEKVRSLCYLTWLTNKEIQFHNQFLSDHPSSRELNSKIKRDGVHINLNDLQGDTIKKIIENKRSLLKKIEYEPIQKEFISQKKKNKNTNWYSLFNGPRNFQQLCAHLKKELIYDFLYRSYSENVHSNNVLKGIAPAGKAEAQIIQIRDFERAHELLMATKAILNETFEKFIEKRLPEKMPSFQEWWKNYEEEFREKNEVVINYVK